MKKYRKKYVSNGAGEGWVYRNISAFKIGIGVCYIPEICGCENQKNICVEGEDHGYTRQDFLPEKVTCLGHL